MKFQIVVILLLAAVSAFSQSWHHHGDKEYYINFNSIVEDRVSARMMCASLRSWLAILREEGSKDFVIKLIPDSFILEPPYAFYIGLLRYPRVTGVFIWEDGLTLHSEQAWWGDREPKNQTGDEDFVVMGSVTGYDPDFKWRSVNGQQKARYICQRKYTSPVLTTQSTRRTLKRISTTQFQVKNTSASTILVESMETLLITEPNMDRNITSNSIDFHLNHNRISSLVLTTLQPANQEATIHATIETTTEHEETTKEHNETINQRTSAKTRNKVRKKVKQNAGNSKSSFHQRRDGGKQSGLSNKKSGVKRQKSGEADETLHFGEQLNAPYDEESSLNEEAQVAKEGQKSDAETNRGLYRQNRAGNEQVAGVADFIVLDEPVFEFDEEDSSSSAFYVSVAAGCAIAVGAILYGLEYILEYRHRPF